MIIEQSPGEVFDRLTILEVKLARIGDALLRRHVTAEHEKLVAAIAAAEPIGFPTVRAPTPGWVIKRRAYGWRCDCFAS